MNAGLEAGKVLLENAGLRVGLDLNGLVLMFCRTLS